MAISNISGPPASGARDIAHKARVDTPKGDTSYHAGLPGSETQNTDGVRLTEYSLRLREVEASLGEEPAFDETRIETLRKAIASGDYRIDSARVASKLLGFENEVFK